jgi:hypothetical protein
MSLRISEFKKPKSIIVDQAKIDSAYGPKSSILLETSASSYSQSGFTIEVKGVSRDSLLSGLFVSIPIQVRWQAITGNKLVVDQFANLDPRVITTFASDGTNKMVGNDAFHLVDNLCIRPNAFKCIRNATLSINGSSFSTRTDAYYTAMCKLFADGRKEDISGLAYESYPYNNCGDKTRQDYQRGWFERCKALNTMGKVKKVTYAGNTADDKVTDIIMEYEVKFPIWFGPYTHLGFPGLSGFDGQTVSALPYCNDLVLECTFSDDPLMDMFACADPSVQNQLGIQNPAWLPRAVGATTDYSPDTAGMWAGFVAGDLTNANNADKLVGMAPPKLCYQFSEPDHDKMEISALYTLPSYRLITYEDRVGWPASTYLNPVSTVRVSFPFIRLSNISSLYICMAECDRIDSGGATGYRRSRPAGASYGANAKALGAACANRTLPIKWDSVKVSMSTQSQVLTNFTANTITAQRQFELFKKYSGDAMGLSFEAWEESSQMLLFSAEELCGIGAFANSFQSLTMSVEFDVYRPAVDTKIRIDDFLEAQGASHLRTGAKRKGNDTRPAIVGRLICLEPELVSISEGALSVEQVKLSQQEIHNQLMGGAPEVEDANRLDQLAR